jgi:hypothetical protein
MELQRSEIAALESAFDPAAYYVPPAEALEKEASRPEGGHFRVIHRETALRADVYLAGIDPLIGWGFERRVRLQVGGGGIWVAPVEYVILRKLEDGAQLHASAAGAQSNPPLRDRLKLTYRNGERNDSPERYGDHLQTSSRPRGAGTDAPVRRSRGNGPRGGRRDRSGCLPPARVQLRGLMVVGDRGSGRPVA